MPVPPQNPAGSQVASSASTHVSSVAVQPSIASFPSPPSSSSPSAPSASSHPTTSAAPVAAQAPASQSPTSAPATSTSIAPHATSAAHAKQPHASTSSTQGGGAQSTALSASTTGSNDDATHTVPVAAIAAASVIGSLVLAAILYKLWIIRARRKSQSAPLPPIRPGFASSPSGSRPGSDWSAGGFGGYNLPFTSNSSRSSSLSEMKFAPRRELSPSPLGVNRVPLSRTYGTAPDVVRDRASREMAVREAESAPVSVPHLPPVTGVLESRTNHGSESHPLSQAHRSSSSHSVAQSVHHRRRSHSHSSTNHQNPAASPQSPTRRLSGAPHLPHVRSRVEIVLPAPLSVGPQQLDGVGNGTGMQRMNSRASMRSADSWTGMSVERHDGVDEGQQNGQQNAPSSWRRSLIPAVPPIPPQHSA